MQMFVNTLVCRVVLSPLDCEEAEVFGWEDAPYKQQVSTRNGLLDYQGIWFADYEKQK